MFELLKLLILKGLKGLNFKDEKKVRSRQNLDDKGMKKRKKYIFFFFFPVAYLKIDILFSRTQSQGWEGDGGFKANFE